MGTPNLSQYAQHGNAQHGAPLWCMKFGGCAGTKEEIDKNRREEHAKEDDRD
jgi:hypothetical protein